MTIAKRITNHALNSISEGHPKAVVLDFEYRYHIIKGTYRDGENYYTFKCEMINDKPVFKREEVK